VIEQGVPEAIECDVFDLTSLHIVAYNELGTPLGTGRLLADGHIGRLAARRLARGQGVGGCMLNQLVDAARRAGHESVLLNAQVHAQAVYQAHGFVAHGSVFQDAGIDHIVMTRHLQLAKNV
jgi:predicted GNAT family N-acyltransferase